MMRMLSLLPVARGESVPPSMFNFTILGLFMIEVYLPRYPLIYISTLQTRGVGGVWRGHRAARHGPRILLRVPHLLPLQLGRLPAADVLLPHHRRQVRRPRRLRPLPRQVDPHREEVHRAGQGRERVALVDGSGFWVPDLCPRLHSVHTDQEVMETPIFFCSGEVILLLLNKNDTWYVFKKNNEPRPRRWWLALTFISTSIDVVSVTYYNMLPPVNR